MALIRAYVIRIGVLLIASLASITVLYLGIRYASRKTVFLFMSGGAFERDMLPGDGWSVFTAVHVVESGRCMGDSDDPVDIDCLRRLPRSREFLSPRSLKYYRTSGKVDERAFIEKLRPLVGIHWTVSEWRRR